MEVDDVHAVLVTAINGEKTGGETRRRCREEVRTDREERGDNSRMTKLAGKVERVHSVLSNRRWVGPCVQKRCCHCLVSAIASPMKRSVTFPVNRVDVSPSIKGRLHAIDVAASSLLHQRLVPR